jgi:hypothetical protein
LLHNGAVIQTGWGFVGTTASDAMWINLDPQRDGDIYNDLPFVLYYTGRLSTWATMSPNTRFSWGIENPAGSDASWFSWN